MFAKYIKYNMKRQPLGYLLILICGVIMLNIMLCSSGIMLNSLTNESSQKNASRNFTLYFEEPVPANELEEKIELFANRMPYEYRVLNIILSGEQRKNDFYNAFNLYFFPNYDELGAFMEEKFGADSSQLPTYAEYLKREKVIMVGNARSPGTENSAIDNVKDGFLEIMGEKYRVSGYYNGTTMYMFWGTQPENTLVSGLAIRMKNSVTEMQSDEIMALYKEIFVEIPLSSEELPETYGLLELRADAANILISVILMFISTFNILLIFKYMLTSRKRCFAIFRFCGFGKGTCVLYSGIEFMTLSAVSAILACIIFNGAVKPVLSEHYNMFDIMFTFDYYSVLIAAYLGISLIMFLVYITPSLTKSVTAELRTI